MIAGEQEDPARLGDLRRFGGEFRAVEKLGDALVGDDPDLAGEDVGEIDDLRSHGAISAGSMLLGVRKPRRTWAQAPWLAMPL